MLDRLYLPFLALAAIAAIAFAAIWPQFILLMLTLSKGCCN